MPFFYYYDPYYWVILLPAILISVYAQIKVSGTFRRYSAVPSRRGMTGEQAAQAVLRAHGVYNVPVERVGGNLTDHYDPRTNVIRLSDGVYGSTSVAALGVAAHEAGHAVQYAQGYGPIRLRTAIIPVCNLGSKLSIILIILGLFLYSQPLEFNASRRAIRSLDETGVLDGEELRGARKVLSAAALTYVAALLVSVAQLLRFLLAFGGRRRD